MPVWVWAAAGVLGFAGASSFFALAESALFSLGRWRMRRLAETHPAQGQRVGRLLDAPQELLATIVLGNTVANAGAIGLTLWYGFSHGWSWGGLALVAAGLFGLLLLGGEVIPKTLALRAPELWSARVAGPMTFLQKFAAPLHRLARALNEVMVRRTVPMAGQPVSALSDEEYQELAEMAAQSGTLQQSEKDMILQIMRLDRRTVKDVMRPRSQMACIPDDLSIEEMVEAARKHRHRRLPMYDASPDTIVGILNTRVLLLDPQVDISEAIEFPSYVPESMNLLQLLKSLQRQQRGMAIVLDEYGGTAGLVTQEDILAEMIGEFRSEGDAQGFVMERLGEGRWRVNGTMRIEDFRREYAALPDVEDVETLGGLVVHVQECVPAVGQVVVWNGLRFTVSAADERRVRELQVEVAGRKGGRTAV